jgi:RHS repeat-associated protein
VQTGYVTGTQDWARLTAIATAPANAHHARVQGILDGSGIAYFDVVKLIPHNTQKFTYDTAGNYINTSVDASGKQQSYTYNQDTGSMLTATDALNRTTTFGYDNLNRLIQVTDPLTKKSYYDFDSVSNLVYSRDPRSVSSTDNTYRSYYGPDSLNRLSNLTDPLNRNAAYIYDRSGNLIQVLLPNGLQQDFAYDAANRLVKTTLDGGKYYSYAYDGANELTGVTDQDNNTYSWSYDGAHRLTSSTDNFGHTLNYGWDKSGNLLVISGYLSYNYGSNNQLLYVTLANGSYIYYDYDENGRIFQVRYPWPNVNNKRVINYAPNGWVTKIQDPSFPGNYSYNYYYNDNGTISGYSSWAGWDSFNYDANGRLTYWNYSPMGGGSGTQENYTYDAAGNLLTKGSRTFTYNSANQITNAGYTYDTNGNMTGDGSKIFIYNALNQLTQVKRASDNVVIATYAYNHNGLRRSKTVSGVTTTYNWDASGNLVRETTAGSSTYFYYVGGKLVGLKKNNTTYIVHDNLRGDVESVTDVNGNIVAQAHYDPWGNRITSSGSLVQPFRYAGYYYDEETGLYYLKNRYYSPVLGRFLTRDGIGYIRHSDPQTLNLYSYAGNNPVNLTDPTGNAPKKLRDLVEGAGGTISWDAKTGIASATVGGKTKKYDIDDFTVVNGRIIVDDADFNADFGKTGYGDVNVTVITPYFVGSTGGVMTDAYGGIHPYEGIAVGAPGFSMSGSGTTKYTVTKGWSIGLAGQLFGHGGQVGWSFGNKNQSAGGFYELGGSAGNSIFGLSISVYYIH